MIFFLLLFVAVAAGPLYLDYRQNPNQSVVVQAGEHVAESTREAIGQLQLRAGRAVESEIHNLFLRLLLACWLYLKIQVLKWFT